MNRLITEQYLLPLKKDIGQINSFIPSSALSFEYIDFLDKEKIQFSFRQDARFYTSFKFENKSDFIAHLQTKNFGYFEFSNQEEGHIIAEFYLDTFIGKPFYELEKLFQHINFSHTICESYRSLGLIALHSDEKEFIKNLTLPFSRKDKPYSLALSLNSANLPYILQNHALLFKDKDIDALWNEWLIKINHYEHTSANKFSESSNVSISQQLGRKAKAFTLKLAGMIVLKQSKSMMTQLFIDYEDILSQKIVFDFFKQNKSPDIRPAFYIYKSYINQYQKSSVLIEEVNLIQKNLTVDITSIMQKHLLNYDKISQLLQSIFNFFKEQPDFQHSLISFIDIDKKCCFSLTSTHINYLNNGKQFLSTVLNDKEIFLNPDKYKSLFFYIHLDNKFEVKNIQSVKSKI